MPSQRKRIGFLPSQEVHEIIEKLCKVNEISQSKLTGLLVEEALKSRGVLSESFSHNTRYKLNFNENLFYTEALNKNNKIQSNSDICSVNKKLLSDDINMIHEFIEFKYFKKVMKQNNNYFE
tara:strand:+ start:169 stop:534 length:366 start_codon:yes stop_codon:yes gene_type:complete